MTSSGTPMTPASAARLLQIVTVAMLAGVLIFAGVLVFGLGVLNQPPRGTLFSLTGIGVAVLAFVAHLVLPEVIVRNNLKTTAGDGSALSGLFLVKTIVATAFLEGAAFVNLVALMTEHHWWSLVVVGGLVLWMASQIPRVGRVVDWVVARQEPQRLS